MDNNSPLPTHRFDWNDIKIRTREVILFLPRFLKNPYEGIKRVPNWDWWTIILLEILMGAACGILGGIVAHHIVAVLGGLFIGPIMNLIITGILSGILYYACLFILQTELDFKKVFIVVAIAKIPAQILSILAPLSHPINVISLLCIIVTAGLLIVGFTGNFFLDKKKMTKIVGTLAGVLVLCWLYSMIMDTTSARIKVQDYTPESLDQIHKELGESQE